MNPWLQRQLKEPIVFRQVPFPQASLSHSLMSRRSKRHGNMITDRKGCTVTWANGHFRAHKTPSVGWGLLGVGIRPSSRCSLWEPSTGKVVNHGSKSLPGWPVKGGKLRTCELDKNHFILFTSRILHPCHFSQIFSLANGKFCAHLGLDLLPSLANFSL